MDLLRCERSSKEGKVFGPETHLAMWGLFDPLLGLDRTLELLELVPPDLRVGCQGTQGRVSTRQIDDLRSREINNGLIESGALKPDEGQDGREEERIGFRGALKRTILGHSMSWRK